MRQSRLVRVPTRSEHRPRSVRHRITGVCPKAIRAEPASTPQSTASVGLAHNRLIGFPSEAPMSSRRSRITTDIDFTHEGKQTGFLRLPHSVHRSAYGYIAIPLVAIRNGKGPRVLIT